MVQTIHPINGTSNNTNTTTTTTINGNKAKDLILDIQFDSFGSRFATASSDQKIRVYRKVNGEFELESSWTAHAATIWHLDWAHPHHGTILASCGFDKQLKTWMPPPPQTSVETNNSKKQSQEWQEITNKAVDRRGSVTDVRFAPVWFGPSSHENAAIDASGYSNTCYLACCTLDGGARVFRRRQSDMENKKNVFEEDRDLVILDSNRQNRLMFKCTTLDWSRLRNADQLIAIGGGGGGAGAGGGGGGEKKNENLLIFRHDPQSTTDKQWAPLPIDQAIDGLIQGPINIARFAHNASPHHTLAIGARQVHIVKIESKTPFQVTPFKTIDPIKLRDKCWRLTWDSIGSVLYSVHGGKTILCWKRNCSKPGEESWLATETQ